MLFPNRRAFCPFYWLEKSSNASKIADQLKKWQTSALDFGWFVLTMEKVLSPNDLGKYSCVACKRVDGVVS